MVVAICLPFSLRYRTILLCDIDTGDCFRSLEGHDAAIWSVAIAPNGKSVASGSRDGSVKKYGIFKVENA